LFKYKILKDSQVKCYLMPCLEDRPETPLKNKPAKVDPEVIERQAYEVGYASGEKAGYEMGQKKAAVLLDRLKKLCTDIKNLKEDTLSQLEPQIILLSITMARKILKEEMSLNPQIVHHLIKEAITKISKPNPVTIKSGRSLYDLLIDKKEEFLEIHPDLFFELDPDVPEGGAVVQSPAEEVPVDLDFQLSNIIEELRTKVQHG
jgi:flagellar assembly protein FliH